MPAVIVEKDIWICWLLEKIFSLSTMQMAFRGGTSLSKVFNLIKRFSEDCDISVDYLNFKSDLDLENKSCLLHNSARPKNGRILDKSDSCRRGGFYV